MASKSRGGAGGGRGAGAGAGAAGGAARIRFNRTTGVGFRARVSTAGTYRSALKSARAGAAAGTIPLRSVRSLARRQTRIARRIAGQNRRNMTAGTRNGRVRVLTRGMQNRGFLDTYGNQRLGRGGDRGFGYR